MCIYGLSSDGQNDTGCGQTQESAFQLSDRWPLSSCSQDLSPLLLPRTTAAAVEMDRLSDPQLYSTLQEVCT